MYTLLNFKVFQIVFLAGLCEKQSDADEKKSKEGEVECEDMMENETDSEIGFLYIIPILFTLALEHCHHRATEGNSL